MGYDENTTMYEILFANKSLLEISEYSKEEFENLNFSELIHPDVSKESIEKTWEIIRKNEKIKL